MKKVCCLLPFNPNEHSHVDDVSSSASAVEDQDSRRDGQTTNVSRLTRQSLLNSRFDNVGVKEIGRAHV